MEVHLFHSTNVFLNLAMEQALFLSLRPGQRALLLWKNDPCVVMGRFQNPWLECGLEKMLVDGVALARRQSGGGTVYHDSGNVNASFMDWNESHSKDNNNQVLVRALKELGLAAFPSGRSDIQIKTPEGNKKVSGAAFKKKKDRSLHHATMLLSADLDRLNQYLLPKFSQEEMSTKAIASVRSKVANIEVAEAEYKETLIKSYEEVHGQNAKVVEWSSRQMEDHLANEPEYLRQISSWQWIYGETPLFQTNLKSGNWNVDISVKKGVVSKIKLENDEVHPALLQDLEMALGQTALSFNAISGCLAARNLQSYPQELFALEALLKDSFTLDPSSL